jgi:hypothetical protein
MFQWLLAVEIWEAHKINLCIQENLASAIMKDQISLLPTSSKEEEVVTAMTKAATLGTHPWDQCKMSLKGFVPHTRLRVWV